MQNFKKEIDQALSEIKPEMFVPHPGGKNQWIDTLGQDLARIFNKTNWFSATWSDDHLEIESPKGLGTDAEHWHSTICMEPNDEEQYLGLKVNFYDDWEDGQWGNGMSTRPSEVRFFVNWSDPNVEPFVSCMEKKLVQKAKQWKE